MAGGVPQRQVHLDFHNSRHIPRLAEHFDGDSFAATLADSGVQSVNVFAKCHHGYSYYPTRVGTAHPGLERDLLGEQIAALHRRGIRAPVYVSVLWDDLAGQRNPGWVITNRAGRTLMRRPLSHDSPNLGQVGWTTLDVSSGYGDQVEAQVAELCRWYDIDGFWFDIVWPEPNYSPQGLERMVRAGVDAADPVAAHDFARRGVQGFMRRIEETVHAAHPRASLFFNGSVDVRVGETLDLQTHLEVESLPTSGADWGYLHYPVVSRFARSFGKDIVGMTGRFHKSWADFGGLKTRDQLLYECATIVSAGGSISVGDQLDPSGVLDAAVYRRLGEVYDRMSRLEPWTAGHRPTAEIAVIAAQAPREPEGDGFATRPALSAEVEGTAQLLLELGYQFDIVDPDHTGLGSYRAVIVPDGVAAEGGLVRRLTEARAGGVRLVLSGTALLQDGGFALEEMPVAYRHEAPTRPSYLRVADSDESSQALASDYDYVFYDPAHVVAVLEGATAVGELSAARFTRSWQHFTSHAQAPVGESLDSPVYAHSDSTLYFAAPVFGAYQRHEYWAYKALARRALAGFLGEPDLGFSGPAFVEATLHARSDTQVVHLVAYQPRRSGSPVPHVDDAHPVTGTRLSVARATEPVVVYSAPDRLPLGFEYREGRVHVDVPPIDVHAVIVIE